MKRWKKMKIALTGICLALLAIIYVISIPTQAKEAQLTLEVPVQVKVGETFTLRVELDSDTDLAAIDARILYDPEIVTFIGDNQENISGSDGLINIKDAYETETKKQTYEITFEAISVGDAAFAFDKTYITDYARLEEVEIYSNEQSLSVIENDGISDNADLSELLVATGTLSPSFSPDVTTYTVTVEDEEDTFIFSSTPADEEAVVTADMPQTLAKGENQVLITVTAPSGAVKEYVIKVYRK